MNDGAASAAHRLSIPGYAGEVQVPIRPGLITIVLGANGTGKSALVQRLVTQMKGRCIYLPGSRPSYFDSDILNITPLTRRQLENSFLGQDQNPVTRYRSISGTQRNDKAIYDLQSAEVQFKLDAAEKIGREGASSDAVALLQSRTSPLDRANHLLRQSNLPIQIVVENAQLMAARSGSDFSIAKMSDGERAALVIISEVKSAPSGMVFLIDEPELHLHRSIVVPMIKSLVGERPDCSFIISTHELALADEIERPQVLLVRGCTWSGEGVEKWDIDVLADASDLPENIRQDVLGSRRRILFVEGKSVSLDRPLYALLFPSVSVQAKDTCLEVRKAVEGLKSVAGLHSVEAFGLVDNDGMSPEHAAKLEASGIFALPFYSVESLYYSREVRQAVATQQAKALKADAEALMRTADAAAMGSIGRDQVDVFAGRIAERRLRDALLSAIPDLEAIRGNPEVTVVVPSQFAGEKARLEGYLAAGEVDAIIERYPVRESRMLNAIARSLRFLGTDDYESAALVQIETDATLATAIRGKLAKLAPAIS